MRRASISNLDQTSGYLGTKLVAGSGISLTPVNPSADATLSIAATGTATAVVVTDISADSTLAGVLSNINKSVNVIEIRDTVRKLITLIFSVEGEGDGSASGFTLQCPTLPALLSTSIYTLFPGSLTDNGVVQGTPGCIKLTSAGYPVMSLFKDWDLTNKLSTGGNIRKMTGQVSYYYA